MAVSILKNDYHESYLTCLCQHFIDVTQLFRKNE